LNSASSDSRNFWSTLHLGHIGVLKRMIIKPTHFRFLLVYGDLLIYTGVDATLGS
jgi:hypothetical protein